MKTPSFGSSAKSYRLGSDEANRCDKKHVCISCDGSGTYNKGLVKLGAQQALFPVIPDNAADGLGDALLDGKVHAGAVVDKLGVDGGVVLAGRREADGAVARLGGSLRLGRLARGGRVHDDGPGERTAVLDGLRLGRGLGLRMTMELRRLRLVMLLVMVIARRRRLGLQRCRGRVRLRRVLVMLGLVLHVLALLSGLIMLWWRLVVLVVLVMVLLMLMMVLRRLVLTRMALRNLCVRVSVWVSVLLVQSVVVVLVLLLRRRRLLELELVLMLVLFLMRWMLVCVWMALWWWMCLSLCLGLHHLHLGLQLHLRRSRLGMLLVRDCHRRKLRRRRVHGCLGRQQGGRWMVLRLDLARVVVLVVMR